MDGINISLHLIADTEEMLSALTIRAQLNWGMVIKFDNFYQRKDGKHVCWYQIPHRVYVERISRVNSKG